MSSHLPFLAAIGGMSAFLLGCPAEEAELAKCDPLETREQPVALGSVVAVGEDVAGKLYVVDRPDAEAGEYRLFISEGGALLRRPVAGTGEVSSAGGQPFAYDAFG